MNLLDERLDALRGPAAPLPHTARTLAALTANPTCDRRALIDAAGIDKDALAAHLGLPRPLRKSRIALRHGTAFEHRVTDNSAGELVRLLRQALGLPLPQVSYEDLSRVAGAAFPLRLRHARTRSFILRAADGKEDARNLFDHPVLRLTVAGHHIYLEPDVVAFRHDGRFHVVEIKSFPVVDGQPDGIKLGAALTQAAAYILALRELLTDNGLPGESVSDEVVLVTPLNFSGRPTATVVNAHWEVRSLSRHLGRLRRLPELLDRLPSGTTLDLAPGPDRKPTRPRRELHAALAALPPHYTPACQHHCDLAFHCRSEARRRGSLEALGTAVREDTAGIDTLAGALALTDNHVRPARDEKDIAQSLRHAQRVYDDFQAGIG
ncbi:hypothetical protein ACFZCY_42765 [Streptomyces sp. NPDC007983]|uniref:hypothetical protein n=1 Tax=Streptomyces sp. NPDC007983 TaxID=3364800 RepID=UPI0036E7B124